MIVVVVVVSPSTSTSSSEHATTPSAMRRAFVLPSTILRILGDDGHSSASSSLTFCVDETCATRQHYIFFLDLFSKINILRTVVATRTQRQSVHSVYVSRLRLGPVRGAKVIDVEVIARAFGAALCGAATFDIRRSPFVRHVLRPNNDASQSGAHA